MFDVERDYLKARRLDLAGDTVRFEALLADSLTAALDAFRLARGRADLAGVLAGGAALYARGLLPVEELAFYASALSADGRHAQAVPVWRETILARPEVAAFHCDLAESPGGRGGPGSRPALLPRPEGRQIGSTHQRSVPEGQDARPAAALDSARRGAAAELGAHGLAHRPMRRRRRFRCRRRASGDPAR